MVRKYQHCYTLFWKQPSTDILCNMHKRDQRLTVSKSATSSGDALGWLRMWLKTTNLASRSSSTGSTVSRTTHRMSKRDKIGSVRSTCKYTSVSVPTVYSVNFTVYYIPVFHTWNFNVKLAASANALLLSPFNVQWPHGSFPVFAYYVIITSVAILHTTCTVLS